MKMWSVSESLTEATVFHLYTYIFFMIFKWKLLYMSIFSISVVFQMLSS